MKTYNDVCITARKVLKSAGIEAYSLEAKLIVAGAADKTIEHLVRDYNLYVNEGFEQRVQEMLVRRIAGEPVAYITGEWEFYGLVLNVDRNVLIPRTDTEVLAAAAIRALKRMETKRVLDLCCGSGCVGLAITANVPASRVVLADKSLKALSVCRSNVLKHSMTRLVTCIDCDALESPPLLMGKYDMLVSNPPYIPTGDIPSLDGSVREYEPVMALDGGQDGLNFYRSIVGKWKNVLKTGGMLLLECGIGEAERVAAMLADNGFAEIETIKDTQEIDRVVSGKYVGGQDNG